MNKKIPESIVTNEDCMQMMGRYPDKNELRKQKKREYYHRNKEKEKAAQYGI